jgi:hypothetical protein
MRYQTHFLNEKTDNYIRTIEFRHPKKIPLSVSIMPATWKKYGETIEKIVLDHPTLFPDYKKGDFKNYTYFWAYEKGQHTDTWGIVWNNIEEGLDSQPVEELAPLRKWEFLDNYTPPNPLTDDWGNPNEKINWEIRKKTLEEIKTKGNLAGGGLPHGFIYMWHYYLRGFSNFMLDVADRDPRLDIINKMIIDYNTTLVNKWIEIGVESMYFGDDMGLQRSLPISLNDWRHYIKPAYKKILGTCKDAGVISYLHSDGCIIDIIDDLIECGLNVINPQFRANGLKNLAKFKGKICINQDMDRQLFPFATTSQLKDHFKEVIDTLYLPEGGLMIYTEIEQDVPLKNVDTIFNLLEEIEKIT